MTEKRFEIIREVYQCYKDLTLYEISNGEHTFYVYDKPVDCSGTAQELCDLLNELHEENKQLKQVINDYGSSDVSSCMNTIFKLAKENEQLEQFKNTVFDLIDKEIKEIKEIFEDGKIDLITYNA